MLCQTNVGYEYKCLIPHGHVVQYIRMIQSTLSQGLTFHRQQWLILEHHRKFHNENISRNTLIKNTKIITIENNYWLKKLYIHKKKKVLLLTFQIRILQTFWNYLLLITPQKKIKTKLKWVHNIFQRRLNWILFNAHTRFNTWITNKI